MGFLFRIRSKPKELVFHSIRIGVWEQTMVRHSRQAGPDSVGDICRTITAIEANSKSAVRARAQARIRGAPRSLHRMPHGAAGGFE